MKGFIKEILRDAAMLSGLIILPIAFLGPGWRPKNDQYGGTNGGRTEGGSFPGKKATTEQSDRYIEILHAFPKDDPKP